MNLCGCGEYQMNVCFTKQQPTTSYICLPTIVIEHVTNTIINAVYLLNLLLLRK
jgi:hypothetical protein